MSAPELSVIVTAYNRPKDVARSLCYLREQSLPADRFEVIVVDDGSTDETPRVLAGLRADLPESFRLLHKENGGPASARNFGIRQASAPIIVLLQDDIFATPEFLARHAAAHAARAGDVIVLGLTRWSPELSATPFMEFLMEGDQFAFAWITDPENVPYNFFYSSNVSFPRAAAERAGLFDEAFPYAAWEDTDLGLRLIRGGLRMIHEPAALAYHHHPTTLASFLRKRWQAGFSSAILFRKSPETGPMMRYDKRPPGVVLTIARPLHGLAAFVASAAERRRWDGLLPPAVRRRFYRALLDFEYFRGVAAGLGTHR